MYRELSCARGTVLAYIAEKYDGSVHNAYIDYDDSSFMTITAPNVGQGIGILPYIVQCNITICHRVKYVQCE